MNTYTTTDTARRTDCEKRALRLMRISRMAPHQADRNTLYQLIRESLDELYTVSRPDELPLASTGNAATPDPDGDKPQPEGKAKRLYVREGNLRAWHIAPLDNSINATVTACGLKLGAFWYQEYATQTPEWPICHRCAAKTGLTVELT